jgi:hypothetical protein
MLSLFFLFHDRLRKTWIEGVIKNWMVSVFGVIGVIGIIPTATS